MGGQAKVNHPVAWLSLVLAICCFACAQKPKRQTKTESPEAIAAPTLAKPDTPADLVDVTNDPVILQARKLVTGLQEKGDYAANHGPDSLLDLNGDGYKDLLIECYGGSGSGFKNGADIYLYDVSGKRFSNKVISLANPTFYFDRKTIATYYLGIGGGYAYTFRWKGKILDTLEYIDIEVDNRKAAPVFTIRRTDLVTRQTTSKVTDIADLPSSYRYGAYAPLIKKPRH